MSAALTVARNYVFLLVAQGYSAATSFITVLILARYLGAADFGLYNYAFAFVGLFEVLSFMGVHTILIRQVARDTDQAKQYVGNALLIKLFLAAATVGLICIAISVFSPDPRIRIVVCICGLQQIISIFGNVNISVFRSMQRMEYEAVLFIIDRTLALGSVFLVVLLRLDVIHLFVLLVVTACIKGSIGFGVTWTRFTRLDLAPDWALMAVLLRDSLPIGISLGLQRVYTRVSTVILGMIRGSAEVGIYAGGMRTVQIVNLAALALVSALYPLFSQLAVSSRESLINAYRASFKMLTIISIPITVLLLVVPRPIVLFLLGADYLESIPVLQILSFSVFLGFVNYLFSFLFRAINRQKEDAINTAASVAVSLTSSLILVPAYGFVGASVASLVTQVVFFVGGLLLSSKYVSRIGVGRILLRPAMSGLVMAAILLVLKDVFVALLVPMALAFYVASLLLFGTFSPQEREFLHKLARSPFLAFREKVRDQAS